MTDDANYLRFGSNTIRAYVGDDLAWELGPAGFTELCPAVSGTLTVGGCSDNPAHTAVYRIWRLGALRILAIAGFTGTVSAAGPVTLTAIPAVDYPVTAQKLVKSATQGSDEVLINAVLDNSAGTTSISCFAGKANTGVHTFGANFATAAVAVPSLIFMYRAASPRATYDATEVITAMGTLSS